MPIVLVARDVLGGGMLAGPSAPPTRRVVVKIRRVTGLSQRAAAANRCGTVAGFAVPGPSAAGP